MADATGTDVAGYVSEGPGLSAYALADGAVYRTYVTHRARPRAGDGLLRRCSTARHAGATRKESSSTGSAATTSTRRADANAVKIA